MKTHHSLAAAQRFKPGVLIIALPSAPRAPAIQVRGPLQEAQNGITDGQPWALARKSQGAATPADTLRSRHATAQTAPGKMATLKQVTVTGLLGLVESSIGQRCDAGVVALDAQQRLGAVVQIDTHEYPPGSRLPAECDRAGRFGVGRVSMRNAAMALDAQERREIEPGSVACIRKPSADTASIFPGVSAFDLTPVPALIESEAAALAAGRVSGGDELAALDKPIGAMCDGRALTEAAGEAVRMFHLAIARLTGNPLIDCSIRQFGRMRIELPHAHEAIVRIGRDDHVSHNDEHVEVPAAFTSRDPSGPRDAMRGDATFFASSILCWKPWRARRWPSFARALSVISTRFRTLPEHLHCRWAIGALPCMAFQEIDRLFSFAGSG